MLRCKIPMDITWFGQSCFRVKGKFATVITDPFDPFFAGLKLPKLSGDVVTVSHNHNDHNHVAAVDEEPFVVSGPGEYEVKGVYITGINVWHDNSGGKERGPNTIYSINIDGIIACHLGDLGHKFSSEQLDVVSGVDILFVPIGGVFTIDAEKAAEVITQVEPKIVIPMHYKIEGLNFEIAPLEPFLKEMGLENTTPVNKLSITKDKLPSETQVIVCQKQ